VLGVLRCGFGADERGSLLRQRSHHSTEHAYAIISAPFGTENKPPLHRSIIFLSQMGIIFVVWFSSFVLLCFFCPRHVSCTSLASVTSKVFTTARTAGTGSPLKSARITTYSQFSQNNLGFF